MALLRQREVHLINTCNAQYDEELLIKAMLWYSDKPIMAKKKVSLHGRYACVSIGHKKVHIAKTHISNHQKGRKPSLYCIERTKESNHKRKGKRAKKHRPDITPFMVYDLHSNGLSFKRISLELNLDWACVKQRYNDFIHDNPELLKGGNDE